MTKLLQVLFIATSLLVSSCINQQPKELPPPVSLMDLQSRYITNSYEHFVASKQYPKTMMVYRNDALLAMAKGYCTIYICLDQQRGRMYVEGKVAADWPVSTGVPGRETATGKFRILEKKETYASNMYGVMYNAEGKRINGDAKSSDEVPEGGKFVPSPMPYWQRISWDGVGMHISRVKAGRRLSHGCIRTPKAMAKTLYDLTTLNKTRVYVVQAPEKAYYVKDILVKKIGLPEMTENEARQVAKAKARAAKQS
ncbi:MAG: L,D-transpeptidase family protein [Akkermansia sp.]